MRKTDGTIGFEVVYFTRNVEVEQMLKISGKAGTVTRYPTLIKWLFDNCAGSYYIDTCSVEFELEDDASHFYLKHA